MPFGIKSAPEIFQRIMDEMIVGIPGAFAIIDDILIAGKTVEDHDRVFRQVVERATQYNLKRLIRQSRVPYMGHIPTGNGLEIYPSKVKAPMDMPRPSDKEGVRRILGFVQYLGKFIPKPIAPLGTLMNSRH